MDRYKYFLMFLFVFSIANADTQEINYGWSLGTLWVHYNLSENKFNADIDVLHFNWLLYNKFILGFNLVSVQGSEPNDEKSYITVLPIEAAFVPLIYNFSHNHQLGLSLYGKTGWELISYKDKEQLENGLYASVGSQLFLQFTEPNSISPYSRYLSLYVEYNFFRGLKFGFNVDVTPIVLFLVLFNNNSE